MKKKYFLISAFILLAPLFVLAFELPAGEPWTTQRISELLDLAANFLIGAGVVGAVITIVWAGILYFTSGFNTKAIESAKGLFKNALIGIAIILGVGVIINTVSVIITGGFFGMEDINNNANNQPASNGPAGNTGGNTEIGTGGFGEPCAGGANCSVSAGLVCNKHPMVGGQTLCILQGGNREYDPCIEDNDCGTGLSCTNGSCGK